MAGNGEKGEEKGFRVEDRRRFSAETGEPREEQAKGAQAASPMKESGGEEKSHGREAGAPDDLPEISFSTFIIGLSTQALMHLGEIPNPTSGKVESVLPVAKQMIDIIVLLREKTRGNLVQGEEKLMDDVLYDLRMRYVEAIKRK